MSIDTTTTAATEDCPDTDCLEATSCRTCDHPICRDHTDEFVECYDGGVHCDDECRDRCVPCSIEIGADR